MKDYGSAQNYHLQWENVGFKVQFLRWKTIKQSKTTISNRKTWVLKYNFLDERLLNSLKLPSPFEKRRFYYYVLSQSGNMSCNLVNMGFRYKTVSS